eukprot:2137201-Rhodomonas_salina.2
MRNGVISTGEASAADARSERKTGSAAAADAKSTERREAVGCSSVLSENSSRPPSKASGEHIVKTFLFLPPAAASRLYLSLPWRIPPRVMNTDGYWNPSAIAKTASSKALRGTSVIPLRSGVGGGYWEFSDCNCSN